MSTMIGDFEEEDVFEEAPQTATNGHASNIEDNHAASLLLIMIKEVAGLEESLLEMNLAEFRAVQRRLSKFKKLVAELPSKHAPTVPNIGFNKKT